MTFLPAGEDALSRWMQENAYVGWVTTDHPEDLESHLIREVPLPLNLDQSGHAFATTLAAIRKKARERAQQLPVA
jgi:hypothetical protein